MMGSKLIFDKRFTARKVSKYGVFSGPYFDVIEVMPRISNII